MMSFKILQSSNIPNFQNSIIPLSRIAGFLALLCVIGCTTPFSKPPLSADAQAEAFSRFSMGLLAEASGDSVVALEHLESAIRLDPIAENLYFPAIAVALKLERPDEALRLARQLEEKHPNTFSSLLLRARVYALTDQPTQAESLFKRAVSDFPEKPEAHLNLARFFLSQDQPAKATQALESAREEHDESVELLQLLGSLIVEQSRNLSDPTAARQNVLEGLRFLEKALKIDGSDPKRWQQIGYIHLSIQQPEKALTALEKARYLLPKDLVLARQVLELSIQTGAYDRALELSEILPEKTGEAPEAWLHALVEKTPPEHRKKLLEYLEGKLQEKNPPIFYYTQLSSLYLDDGRTEEAKTALRTALTIHPDNGRLRTVLGTLQLQEGKYDEAYATFNRVRTDSPNTEWAQSPFFAFNFMIAAQKSDHLEDAVTTLASTYTNDPIVLNQYMHSLLTGQSPVSTRSAIDLLESFHQMSPKAAEALYYLTLLQAEEQEYVAALENARQFEALAKNQESTNLLDGFFYFQYATLHERTGQLEEAEKYFFKAIEMGDASTAASAQNYIAYMWAERGEKLEFSLGLIEQAMATEPNNAAFIDTLGWIYYMQGRYEEALTQLKTACEIFSEDPTIWEHLGDTYLKLGNPTAARVHWEKAFDLAPDEKRLMDRLEISPDNRPAEEDNLEDTPLHP